MEIHDSRLIAVQQEGGAVILHFNAAYVHASEGRPGVDKGTGWSQELKIFIESGVIEGAIPELPCDLTDGQLKFGGNVFSNIIPIPFDQRGETELLLEANWNSIFKIKGIGCQLLEIGTPRYVEEFKSR
jgi:hypothetical protein